MDWVRCVGWVRWVGWVQRRRSGTQRHYCLSVEQRAGEILRYGDLRSRALHGRETMQELRGLVTANEVRQSACIPKGRSPRCDLYPLGHRDDDLIRHCDGASATEAISLFAGREVASDCGSLPVYRKADRHAALAMTNLTSPGRSPRCDLHPSGCRDDEWSVTATACVRSNERQ